MNFRWTIEELEKTTPKLFVQAILAERKSSLTNIYSPLSKKITEVARKIELLPDDLCLPQTKKKKK
jgi:hypothetical protein